MVRELVSRRERGAANQRRISPSVTPPSAPIILSTEERTLSAQDIKGLTLHFSMAARATRPAKPSETTCML